jgi:uracil phosphoribosyltransferase
LTLVPGAEVWHLGLYRDEETLKPVEYYNRLSPVVTPTGDEVHTWILLDPMLATGGSAIAAVDVLRRSGRRPLTYVGLIAAPEGIEALQSAHPDIDIHVGAIDDHLNEHGYIVPGLGDAGDRQFGT